MKKRQIIQVITVFSLALGTNVATINAQETNPDEVVLDQQIVEETSVAEEVTSEEIVVEAVEVPETLTSEEPVQVVNRTSRAAVTYPATIESIFPDPAFATLVAQMLGKEVTDSVVKADLETIQHLSVFGETVRNIMGIEELSQLQGISLMSVGVDDLSYVDWSKMPKLLNFNLMDTKITDLNTIDFSQLTGLMSITIMNNDLENINIDWSPLKELQSLILAQNKIKDVKSVNWTGLDKLLALDLSSNQISDISFAWTGLPEVTNIMMFNNQISDISKADFSGLPKLTGVSIDMQMITVDKEVMQTPLVVDNIVIINDGGIGNVGYASEEGVYDAATGKTTWNTLADTVTEVMYQWQNSLHLDSGLFIGFSGTVTVPLGPGFDLTFKDYDGNILKQTLKAEGAKIVAPTVPNRPGYTFTGWTPSLDAVMPAQATEYVATYTKDATAPVVNEVVVKKPTVDLGRTCQDDGYPNGYYWNGNACVIAAQYSVPNTGTK